MRSLTFSQWKDLRMGVIWVDLKALTTARAREFWICWSRLSWQFERLWYDHQRTSKLPGTTKWMTYSARPLHNWKRNLTVKSIKSSPQCSKLTEKKHHLMPLQQLYNGLACPADYSIFARDWTSPCLHMRDLPVYGQRAGLRPVRSPVGMGQTVRHRDNWNRQGESIMPCSRLCIACGA